MSVLDCLCHLAWLGLYFLTSALFLSSCMALFSLSLPRQQQSPLPPEKHQISACEPLSPAKMGKGASAMCWKRGAGAPDKMEERGFSASLISPSTAVSTTAWSGQGQLSSLWMKNNEAVSEEHKKEESGFVEESGWDHSLTPALWKMLETCKI